MNCASAVRKYSSDLRVLYVEDDDYLRVQGHEIFKLLFKETKVAVDGEDGLNHYRFDGKFDLVVTDICMPKMNGVEMVDEIKKIDPDQAIVVISAYDDSKYLSELINLGINHFILKPVEVSKVMSVLLKVCKEIHNEKELNGFYDYLKGRVDEEYNRRKESEMLLIRQAKMAMIGQMVEAITYQLSDSLDAFPKLFKEMAVLSHSGFKSDIKDCANRAMMQVDHMSQMLDEFKRFLKSNTSKGRFVASESISVIYQTMQVFFESKEIEVAIEKSDYEIYGFENEFKQVILNLFSNAVDAIYSKKAKGFPDYKGKISVRFANRSDGFSILVEDNGIGIDEEVVDRVFDPYFSTKGGSGAGLYIAKNIVESSLQGTIRVVALADKTVFVLDLPFYRFFENSPTFGMDIAEAL